MCRPLIQLLPSCLCMQEPSLHPSALLWEWGDCCLSLVSQGLAAAAADAVGTAPRARLLLGSTGWLARPGLGQAVQGGKTGPMQPLCPGAGCCG